VRAEIEGFKLDTIYIGQSLQISYILIGNNFYLFFYSSNENVTEQIVAKINF